MTQSDFRTSIVSSFDLMNSLGLTDWSRFPNQKNLAVDDEFKKVILNSTSKYEDIYRSALGLAHYNFILEDYSFFQFSIHGIGDHQSMRYAFYPNPYLVSDTFEGFSKDMITEGEVFVLGELYSQELDEAELSFLVPPIRYDYEPQSYLPTKHPAAHLHIGVFQSSRVALRRQLSPLAFTFFVAKNYYPIEWAKGEDLDPVGDGFLNSFDRKFALSKKDCALLNKELFSEADESLPYLD